MMENWQGEFGCGSILVYMVEYNAEKIYKPAQKKAHQTPESKDSLYNHSINIKTKATIQIA
jgi:hypothetical protein